ncbi:MAG: adenosylmethionine--8-amino-7-oxononanoate transaminase [Proteobacteria bacterium]|nr:adenosylmethionine--8-amino-7-oxononanoate transaminase [Pseudomonadota bacterium]
MAQNATVWLPYAQMLTAPEPLTIQSTQGTRLIVNDGLQLIDGVASWWTACHGYNHPHIINAIQVQAQKLAHVMLGGLVHPQATKLANRLVALLPSDLNHVFYSESGSVAVEVAMKMALQFWINHQEPQRQRFIYFKHGYHGDTFYTMSVSDPQDGIHPPFESILVEQYLQKLPTTDDLLETFELWIALNQQHIAGLLLEPLVQAAGGMKMHSPATLQAIVNICQRYNILVIIDEVFTGFGRTGSLFAIDQAGIVPDIFCLSKALTGGTLPLATTIATTKIYNAFLGEEIEKGLMHGTTFMGNALACAAANASLDLFETEPRLNQVADISDILKAELMNLQEVPGVLEVRVKGAIGAVQLAHPLTSTELKWFKQNFIDDGVWCRPLGDIVYTTPAFTIDKASLVTITSAMSKYIKQWSSRFFKC